MFFRFISPVVLLLVRILATDSVAYGAHISSFLPLVQPVGPLAVDPLANFDSAVLQYVLALAVLLAV